MVGIEASEDARGIRPVHLVKQVLQVVLVGVHLGGQEVPALDHALEVERDPAVYEDLLVVVVVASQGLDAAGDAQHFPPVLAFQSVADATVSTQAVIDDLFGRLLTGGHELVLFDINRVSEVEQLLKEDPGPKIEAMFRDESLSFTVSLVTNESNDSRNVVVCRKIPGSLKITEISFGLKWDRGIYSLSHVALPFSINDPLYGGSYSGGNPGIRLGNMALRGERGVLQTSAADMLRLRWNPFYPYMERRLLELFNIN